MTLPVCPVRFPVCWVKHLGVNHNLISCCADALWQKCSRSVVLAYQLCADCFPAQVSLDSLHNQTATQLMYIIGAKQDVDASIDAVVLSETLLIASSQTSSLLWQDDPESAFG